MLAPLREVIVFLSLSLFPPFLLFLFLFHSNYFSPECGKQEEERAWIACYSRFIPRLSVEPASGLLFLPFPRRTWKIAVYFAPVIAFSFAELFPVYVLRQRLMH